MAISNKERIGRALDIMAPELARYIEQELRDVYADDWGRYLADAHLGTTQLLDPQRLVNTMINNWDDVFDQVLTKDVRSRAHDVRVVRNKHAHEPMISVDDTIAGLIDIQKLLEAIKSPEAEKVESSKLEVMRMQFDTERKKEERRTANQPLTGLEVPGLRPWREVVIPHQDVAQGTFQQAEFAADLWQVYLGQGSDEYLKPIDFFGRTYLTEGLKELLKNGLNRLTAVGGDPVVELQINFGGGKTHSMLALYHLFGGQAKPSSLPGVDELFNQAGVTDVPTVRRAVIVGTALRPGSPLTKDDGTVVRTLWGELAWQLAGRTGYEIVREADETSTNPGDLLDELFRAAGPSLILIDEWVAYARQLFDRKHMLPAGDFDTQFTFAQTLCEAARRAKNVLVCISIPASVGADGSLLPSTQAGDDAGQAALDRLKAAVGRSNLVWRPATSDESFEIVRRRLFQPIPGDLVGARDAVIREFAMFYKANPNEFPSECREGEYERRMKAAYPIHPELFDRLYEDWSSLEKFQRTRGVLRLMASVIHSLWKNNDQSALIMPAMVPIADATVQSEIIRYLPENWAGVIDRDVDGENSVPLKLDGEFAATFGRFSASRRVARTIFLGSAPTRGAAGRGIDDKHVRLGCVQPKETIATFGDALGRLRQKTLFLYADATRFWYDTQASINREAQDRADAMSKDAVIAEVVRRLKDMTAVRLRGEFGGVHADVASSDIPDDRELRLVVLGPSHLHKRGRTDSDAIGQAKDILEYRGSAPRSHRNRLVFLACDEARWTDLEGAVRQYLAWDSIVTEVQDDKLDLDKANRDQALSSAQQWNRTVTGRINEAYQHVLVPTQLGPQQALSWTALHVSGGDENLAIRVIRKLEPEHLVRKLGGNLLIRDIERVPLWDSGGMVSVDQLVSYYASYPYLYRLVNDDVLFDAVRDAVNRTQGLAYADGYDPDTKAFEKLRMGILLDGPRALMGYLVKPDIAEPLIDQAVAATPPLTTTQIADAGRPLSDYGGMLGGPTPTGTVAPRTRNKRFHATIRANSGNLSTLAGNVSREVAQHLASVLGSEVRITIEVDAECGDGYADNVVRIVSENCRTLKFDSFDFEEE
ncbi:MAG: DUF499 domain-containing protein [Fimbriimonadaceae bacterium]|nr:DUF499 domain-containing protein [Fimbriimonadaceae bacterium]